MIAVPGPRTIAVVAVIAAAIGVVAWNRHDAAQDVRDRVEDQNNDAGNAADAVALGRRECVRSGGVWIFEAGRCERS